GRAVRAPAPGKAAAAPKEKKPPAPKAPPKAKVARPSVDDVHKAITGHITAGTLGEHAGALAEQMLGMTNDQLGDLANRLAAKGAASGAKAQRIERIKAWALGQGKPAEKPQSKPPARKPPREKPPPERKPKEKPVADPMAGHPFAGKSPEQMRAELSREGS